MENLNEPCQRKFSTTRREEHPHLIMLGNFQELDKIVRNATTDPLRKEIRTKLMASTRALFNIELRSALYEDF